MELVTAVVFGIVFGALYALGALGVVLVYRVSRVLNFALAGTATLTTYEASSLTSSHWPYVVVVAAVLVSGAVLGAACYGILSLARNASAVAIGIGTIGLLLLMQGSIGSIWGLSVRSLPVPLGGVYHLGSIGVSHFQVMTVVVALVAVLLVFLLVFRSRLGLRMRAVSAGPRTAELLGVNRRRTVLWAWVVGGALGSLAGLFIATQLQVDQNVIVDFMLASFAAVVLGGFTSLGGVVLAGVTVGIVLNILSTFVSSTLTDTFTFLFIALVLFLRPHGLFGLHETSVAEPHLPTRHHGWASRRAGTTRRRPSLPVVSVLGRSVPFGQTGLGVVVVAILVYGVIAGATTSYVFATVFANFIAILGVGVIYGLSGQLSLGQGAFVALGAYSSGIVSAHLHASIWLSLPLAVVVGLVVGLVVGWPAARLSGVYLVVFTLAFGLAVPELLLNGSSFTGGASGLTISIPSFFNNSRIQFLVALAIAAIVAAAAAAMSRSQLGRRWRAVRDSEEGTAGIGWNPTVNKVTAFAIGSAMAAIGGWMTGVLTGFVGPGGFSVFFSIYLVIAVVIGGPGTILGGMIGAMVITLLPYYLAGSNTPQLIFGIAVVAILIIAPEGLTNRLALRTRRVAMPAQSSEQRLDGATVEVGVSPVAVATTGRVDPEPRIVDPVLVVDELTVAYDGGLALSDVSLQVGPGEALAVVGPNGAGKSTLLRAISSWVSPLSGTVRLNGLDITGRPAHQISGLGLIHVPEGRGVFPGLSVAENLRLGYRRTAVRSEQELLDQILEIFPKLKQRLGQDAGSMSGGEQQMLAVGRGLMADPEVLMLDEPSLGLAPLVIGEMFEALSTILATGVAVLLIEQNVHAALGFADRGVVLSHGECVMRGSSTHLTDNDHLISHFLV